MKPESSIGMERAPQWVLMLMGAYFGSCMLALFVWSGVAQAFSIQFSTGSGIGPLPATGAALLGAWLCFYAAQKFDNRAPVRFVWLLAGASSAVAAIAGELSYAASASFLASTGLLAEFQVRAWVAVLQGPVQTILLGAALCIALRTLRRFGFVARPTSRDWMVVGVSAVLCQSRAIEVWMRGPQSGGVMALCDLLLCVVVFEAMLVLAAAARMGSGLVARCWVTLAAAVLFHCFGRIVIVSLSGWTGLELGPALQWYVSLPGAMAMALAPAYQVAAQYRAVRGSRSRTKPGFSQPRLGTI